MFQKEHLAQRDQNIINLFHQILTAYLLNLYYYQFSHAINKSAAYASNIRMKNAYEILSTDSKMDQNTLGH